MQPSRPWKFLRAAALGALAAALAMAVAAPGIARAQACCAGGAVVTPTRLAQYEDGAVGVQVRGRSNGGSFDATGTYRAFAGGEHVFEQGLAASFRLARAVQVGALLPILQTHRSAAGLDDWGGGIGDLAVTGRYDLLVPGELRHLPGVGLLAGVTVPTGRAPNEATHPLAADATGAGTFDGTIGVNLESARGHLYGSLSGWLTHRFARRVTVPGAAPIEQSFGLRATVLAVAGYAFDSEAALGLFVSLIDERSSTIDGAVAPGTRLRLTTAGLAGVFPLAELWRLQGTLFSDVGISGFGRNEPAGRGLTAALVRAWL